MKQVKTKVRIIIEGNIAYVNSTSNCIEIEIDSVTRDLWDEQLTIDARTITDGAEIYNGDGVVRTKTKGNKGKIEFKAFRN